MIEGSYILLSRIKIFKNPFLQHLDRWSFKVSAALNFCRLLCIFLARWFIFSFTFNSFLLSISWNIISKVVIRPLHFESLLLWALEIPIKSQLVSEKSMIKKRKSSKTSDFFTSSFKSKSQTVILWGTYSYENNTAATDHKSYPLGHELLPRNRCFNQMEPEVGVTEENSCLGTRESENNPKSIFVRVTRVPN